MPARVLVFLFLSELAVASANKIPASKLLDEMIHRSTLAEPGGKPFYLKATITDRDDAKSEFNGTVEEYWVSPTKWRRVIKLRDFSQTRIVNGEAVYEDNNGDYFPLHDEMLANEIVDPLPKSAVELIKKLDLAGPEPGSGEGQCMAEKYFNDAEGKETRVLLAYNCKTGLLIYLWSPSCCYGVMTDYRKFHDKRVAFATKDDPINIRVDTLRDLDNPDETLFAISQPTPLDKRVATEKLSETEARKLITEKGDIQWPNINRKPGDQAMSVNLVIGRDGRVKEAWSYSPIDNATEEAALSAIRKWTFIPQRVDGIPAQVETTLIIPFPAPYFFPSLARFALAEPDSQSGWYGEQLLFHLSSGFKDNNFFRYCSPRQRRAVSIFLGHIIESRAALVEAYAATDQFLRCHELWSDAQCSAPADAPTTGPSLS